MYNDLLTFFTVFYVMSHKGHPIVMKSVMSLFKDRVVIFQYFGSALKDYRTINEVLVVAVVH